MVDVVTPEVRSRMMAGIGGKNTKPELLIRRLLFAKGLRYRLHASGLPGKPDLVFAKHHVAVFIHGCFWHQHDCHLFKWPQTRTDFWKRKIEGNKARDTDVLNRLASQGWRVLIVWECAVKGKARHNIEQLADRIAKWIKGKKAFGEIAGVLVK